MSHRLWMLSLSVWCGRCAAWINYCEATLRSTFELDYPRYEVLFCAAKANDPVLPLLERLMAAHPHVDARILIGDDRISRNPKLNNVIKDGGQRPFNGS